MTRWVNRPEGSNWGDFGLEDQLGTLNYIGDEQRLSAAKEIREGRLSAYLCRLISPEN